MGCKEMDGSAVDRSGFPQLSEKGPDPSFYVIVSSCSLIVRSIQHHPAAVSSNETHALTSALVKSDVDYSIISVSAKHISTHINIETTSYSTHRTA